MAAEFFSQIPENVKGFLNPPLPFYGLLSHVKKKNRFVNVCFVFFIFFIFIDDCFGFVSFLFRFLLYNRHPNKTTNDCIQSTNK